VISIARSKALNAQDHGALETKTSVNLIGPRLVVKKVEIATDSSFVNVCNLPDQLPCVMFPIGRLLKLNVVTVKRWLKFQRLRVMITADRLDSHA